jgi:DNA-binding MarR family transcriptional regulator
VPDAIDRAADVRAEAWHGLLRVHRDVSRVCDSELVRTHGISLSAFDVLHAVGRAPGGALDMSTLVRTALLSQSQVSRTVATLVRDGLLERHGATARSVRVSITPEGRERLAAAGRTQAETLDAVLFGALDAHDARHLAELLARVQAGDRYPRAAAPQREAAEPLGRS